MAGVRIALLNVKFSPNLGDGLLSECLERELARALPGAEVMSIDLAGRRTYRGHGPSRRGLAIKVLQQLPRWARRHAVRGALTLLVRFRLRRHVRERLAGVDAVVVGGGNLLTDSDLNFPMKLSGALAEAERLRLPVAVHAVGASRRWSPTGHRLFAVALRRSRLIAASVRDERSQGAWRDLLEPLGIMPATISGDPGLLTRLHFPAAPRPAQHGPAVIALCITSPLAVRYHASGPAPRADLGAWYGEAAAALLEAGHEVVLFTNGSPEDRAFLAANHDAWTALPGHLRVAPAFATPTDLAAFIAASDLVIAHRMHACIAAHAFAVPAIGLKWDVKLDSFFALAGREQFIADCADLAPGALVALVAQALSVGVDREQVDRLIAQTRADVAALADRIRVALDRPIAATTTGEAMVRRQPLPS